MCIIVYKQKDVKIPDKFIDTLETCFDNNPDGAGILYEKDGKLHIEKGFMTFDSFKRHYEKLNFSDKDIFVLHFRIATQGNIDQYTCHPFPISHKVKHLKATTFHTNFAMVHNGCISMKDENDDLSDSQLFVRDVLSQLNPADIYNDGPVKNLISMSTSGSKLLLWHTEYGIMTTGLWQKDKEIYYSNDTHKTKVITYHSDYNWYGRKTTRTWNSLKSITNNIFNRKIEKADYRNLPEYNIFDDTDDTDDLSNDDNYIECAMCGEYVSSEDTHKLFNDNVCDNCYNDYMDYDYNK
jgi:predicted glutamine amidotransferase